jgi:predicted permease
LLNEARALPGVLDATLSFAMLGFMDGDCVSASQTEPPRKLNLNLVESNYFELMRVRLLRGRNFVSADRPESTRVIIVNETMARLWWPGQDPIGKTAWLGCQESQPRIPAEVIGVARDSKYGSLDEQPRPFYFAYWRQVWWNGFFALALHTAGEPYTLAEPLLKLARTGGSDLRIYELRSFEDLVALSLWRIRWQATLVAALGLLAIVLAAVGLYGVVAYMVAQRTREIGIRIALGARTSDVKWMVLGRALRLTSIGILLGLALSAAVTRLLRGFLFGVSPLDPVAFTAAALGWILISMLASYVPARRATRVDPVVALRYE